MTTSPRPARPTDGDYTNQLVPEPETFLQTRHNSVAKSTRRLFVGDEFRYGRREVRQRAMSENGSFPGAIIDDETYRSLSHVSVSRNHLANRDK